MEKKKKEGRILVVGFLGLVPPSLNESICDCRRMNLKLKKRHHYMTRSSC